MENKPSFDFPVDFNLPKFDENYNAKKKFCYYCGNTNHLSRNCPLERDHSPILKEKIGNFIEHYISKYDCPYCENNSLHVFDDNSPSLDIYCKECGQAFEVKSKCLSIKNLPDDIVMPHGSYIKFKKRVDQGISFVFVIYEVDRKKKKFTIRKVLFASHDEILNNKKVIVDTNQYINRSSNSSPMSPKKNNNNSIIKVPNINELDSWNLFHPIKENEN